MKINQCINTSIAQRNESFSTLATSCEELTHWKRLWCWEGLGAGEEGDNRGWDGWMAGWHHWLDGREFEWTPGVGDGQGGLACCDSWGHKESDTTERLNWTELNVKLWFQTYFYLLLVCWVPKNTSLAKHLPLPSFVLFGGYKCFLSLGKSVTRYMTFLAPNNSSPRIRRQESRPSPWKRKAKTQNGCLGRPYE